MSDRKKFWTLRYIIINATYFAVYSGIHAYASVFLLEKGFSNTLIGITLALANILSVVFQPIVAGIIDKQGKLTNRNVSMASTVLLLIGSILLLLIKNGVVVIFIIFALIYMVQMVYQPIITAMYFEYEAAGCHIYYGLARGLGSCGFAIVSFFTGRAIGWFGVNILMILDIIFLAIALAVLYFFKKPKVEAPPIEKNEVAHNNLFSFIKTYPGFMLFVLAAVCFFFAHNAINDYMIQIITPLGGTEAQMGIAVSCAAILELPTMALIDKIMKKISVKNLLLISATAFLIKTLLMLIAPNMGVVYISQAMQMLAYAVFIPAGAYFVNRTMARLDQVKGQAYINCSITLGGVFSSLVCGRLLDIKGPHFMLIVSLAVTATGLVIAFFALKVLRTKTTSEAKA
ncbi:MAG: MFS transporter [Clostridiales bacterium]|nr:MFS transporter [Clostridiales bacterium]MBR6987699.1 MFS transporter [Clostridiales bacterium]